MYGGQLHVDLAAVICGLDTFRTVLLGAHQHGGTGSQAGVRHLDRDDFIVTLRHDFAPLSEVHQSVHVLDVDQ